MTTDNQPPASTEGLGPIARALLEMRSSDNDAEDSMLTEFFEELKRDERVGGVPGIVDFTAETHKMTKDSTRLNHRMRWIKMMLDIAQESERLREERRRQFTDEELHGRMVAAVIEEIRENPRFALAMVIEAVRTLKYNKDYTQMVDKLIEILEDMKQLNFERADNVVAALIAGDDD